MRYASIDALRGVLILLMVTVHAAFWLYGQAIEQYLLAVLFGIVAGALSSPQPSARYVWLGSAALVSWPPFLVVGVDYPILTAFAVLYPVIWYLPQSLLPVVGVAAFWAIDAFGGPVSFAAAALGLGVGVALRRPFKRAARAAENGLTTRILQSGGVCAVGRWPLTVYAVHIWLLAAVAGALPW